MATKSSLVKACNVTKNNKRNLKNPSVYFARTYTKFTNTLYSRSQSTILVGGLQRNRSQQQIKEQLAAFSRIQ